jgi:hypothetical protein
MTEPRFIACPYCDGQGGADVFTGVNPRDGSDQGYYERCEHCLGSGEIEGEAEPITLEDLDEIAPPQPTGPTDALLAGAVSALFALPIFIWLLDVLPTTPIPQ